jgi:hypothetical protein
LVQHPLTRLPRKSVLIIGLLGFLLDAGARGLYRMTGRDH